MEILLGLVLILLVGGFVSVPLLRERAPAEAEDSERAELEDRKQAKYREIRDLELDHESGKVEAEEYQRQRGLLRAEAIEILDRIERVAESRAAGEPRSELPDGSRGTADRP